MVSLNYYGGVSCGDIEERIKAAGITYGSSKSGTPVLRSRIPYIYTAIKLCETLCERISRKIEGSDSDLLMYF